MPAIHIRDVDDAVISALKERAARHHRSLQGEVRTILEAAVQLESRGGRRARRQLQIRTVRVGSRVSYSRDTIYDEDGR